MQDKKGSIFKNYYKNMAISTTHPHNICVHTHYMHLANLIITPIIYNTGKKSFILKRFFLLYLKNNASQGIRFSGFQNLVCEVKRLVIQLCQTLCDPVDYTVYGILQARILEWVAFPLSEGSLQPRSLALQEDSSEPAEPPGRRKP